MPSPQHATAAGSALLQASLAFLSMRHEFVTQMMNSTDLSSKGTTSYQRALLSRVVPQLLFYARPYFNTCHYFHYILTNLHLSNPISDVKVAVGHTNDRVKLIEINPLTLFSSEMRETFPRGHIARHANYCTGNGNNPYVVRLFSRTKEAQHFGSGKVSSDIADSNEVYSHKFIENLRQVGNSRGQDCYQKAAAVLQVLAVMGYVGELDDRPQFVWVRLPSLLQRAIGGTYTQFTHLLEASPFIFTITRKASTHTAANCFKPGTIEFVRRYQPQDNCVNAAEIPTPLSCYDTASAILVIEYLLPQTEWADVCVLWRTYFRVTPALLAAFPRPETLTACVTSSESVYRQKVELSMCQKKIRRHRK